MRRRLFLFTIGPVQSFISQARKARDLYFGSYILSSLCMNAITYLRELKKDTKIIFPNEKFIFEAKKSEIPSIPNRFLASIPIEDNDEIYQLADDLIRKVKQSFRNISMEKHNLNEEYESQIEDFLELYWASTEEGNDYRKNYLSLETAIGAIKSTRSFNQVKHKPGLRKCSVCGQRNALVKGNNYLQNNEELCAICWTKRSLTKTFPSTAGIALMQDVYQINKYPEGEKVYNNFKNRFGKAFDEEFLYEENLRSDYFHKNNINIEVLNTELFKNAKILNRFILDNNLNYTKYYALLALDGDDMGKWMSGENYTGDYENFRKFHQKVSYKLINYNKKVLEIIKEPRGKIVFSGGDDILAFVNLYHLLDVLHDLRNEFPQFDNNKQTTASCGVCIAHYKTPLNYVIKKAKEAENSAKKMDNKNSFSIVILKHSGEINQSTAKWKYNELDTINVIKKILSILNKKYFSTAFINNIQEEFRLVEKVPVKSIETEIARLIMRSCVCDCNNKQKYGRLLIENVINLFKITNFQLLEFFNLLNIISFLYRKGDNND